MSQFHPTSVTIEPPPVPDYAAAAALQALSRPVGAKLSWGVFQSLFWGVVTFGLFPLAASINSFRAFVAAEQHQFGELAQWLRLNSSHPLARRLQSDAGELRSRAWLWLLPMAIFAVTALMIGSLINESGRRSSDALLAGTYGFGPRAALDYHRWTTRESQQIFSTWCWGLSAAYLCHFLQVHLHALDVGRFVARFSQIGEAEGLLRVRASGIGLGVRPLWLLAGLAMFAVNAPWGVVAMLAGGVQRRYINHASRATRAEVAQRLRAMLIRRRPPASAAAGVPVPVYLRERCVEAKCRAEIPRGVNYCPRCGTRQRPRLDYVG